MDKVTRSNIEIAGGTGNEQTDDFPLLALDIRREGRAWRPDEMEARLAQLLELKLEISRGKLFWSEETRQTILGLLLENVGIDAAIRLGDLSRWKEAIAAADRERDDPEQTGPFWP